MKVCFTALGVPVLNFSHQPDSSGMIIPPEAHATFKDVLPVTYGGGGYSTESVVGHVRLYRNGNTVYGDFTLFSVWGDDAKALEAIRFLRPAACLSSGTIVGPALFKFEIEGVIVTSYENQDKKIERFGNRMVKRPAKGDMN